MAKSFPELVRSMSGAFRVRPVTTILTTIGMIAALLLVPAQAGAASPLSVTSTSNTRVLPNSTTALSGLAISGDTVNTLQATVSTDLGTLSISTTTGLTLGYNNNWSGTPSITFTGTQANINAGLASVKISTSGTTGTAQVALTAMVAQSSYYYLASNQHFYQYVAHAGVSWTQADVNARLLSFNGQPGYLATIPDVNVNSFISSKIANASNVWFGLRAYEKTATDGSQVHANVGGTNYARVWRWTVGPDQSSIAGGVVSRCTNATGLCSFDNSGNPYSSWASQEPNNYNANASVAYSGEYVAVTNWSNTLGQWNDLPPSHGGASGYIVEYGGKANSNPTLGTGFSGVVTATSNVLVANAATVPGAPIISGTPGNASASLSWNPPSDGGEVISKYQVSVNGQAWTDIATSSSTSTVNGNIVTTVSATVTGLTNGSITVLAVRGVNSVGSGAASAMVTLTPLGSPGAPTGVSATGGNGQATVSFTPPGSNGGAPITGYTVTASPGGASATCSSSPCTVTGLSNGTAYTFTARATNSVGNSPESSPSAAVTPATVPGAPTGVSATRGNGQATVSFTPPASNGGSSITGYTVTASPGGASVTCSSSPCTVTGLSNGTAYTFTARATNSVGNSAASSPSAAVTPATVPDAPTGVSAVSGNGQATVSFTPPASTGGAPITGYTVTSSPGGATATCSSSPCTVTGLANGTAYTFTVRATNGLGNSVDSTASGSVTPATVPDAPPSASAIRGDSQATVTFATPSGNGSAITGYKLTASPGGATTSCSSSPCTVTGLTNGTAYTFRVVATNDVGDGPASSPTAAVTPAAPPGVPAAFSTERDAGAAVLHFDAPADNGSPITGYEVSIEGGTWIALAASGSTSLTATVAGLNNGTSYSFRVRAVNGAGAGSPTGSESATPATVPDAPTIVSVSGSNTAATVSFDAPASDGGDAITGYTVTTAPEGITHECVGSPCVISGLSNGTAYTFKILATNSVGNSAQSSASDEVTPATVPGAPTGVSAESGHDGGTPVSFTAPADDGGAAITSYTVTSSPGVVTAVCSSSPCTVTGLTNGTAYSFTVHATSAAGDSTVSTPSSVVTPATVPGVPKDVSAKRGDGTATVSFVAPSTDGGSAITGFVVTASPGGAQTSCVTSPCVIKGLGNGTAYTFSVLARNALGDSAESATSSAVIPAGEPGKVSGVKVVANNGSATVSFDAPDSNGAPITGYVVSVEPGGTRFNCAASPCTLNGLTNGTTYTFKVRAANDTGDGVDSAGSAATPAGPPAPAGKASVERSGSKATVTWVAPTSLNGATITGYTVVASPGGGSCTPEPGATSCTIVGLDPSVTYSFNVVTHSSAGDSVVAATDEPSKPRGSGSSNPESTVPGSRAPRDSDRPQRLAFTGTSSENAVWFALLALAAGGWLDLEGRRRRRNRSNG